MGQGQGRRHDVELGAARVEGARPGDCGIRRAPATTKNPLVVVYRGRREA